ncbi:hypothetical protein AKUA2003_07880 [Apilactobacillus kunkeei]|nr:hypothetical protein AKUA1001_07900 [Apilactobacillus kunkeei]CAI2603762.1 hypothetical protein AKUA2003_07880 [Apilactobacillus kunkeei]CAI2802352.1 hypothetical protein AKUA2002_07900 [Apilactobacillus kunkeei]
MMKFIISNLLVIFWSVIFGEIIGYIASQLTGLSYNINEIGVVSAVVVLIAVNALTLISKYSVK